MYVLQMKIKSTIRLNDGRGNTDYHVKDFKYEDVSQVTFPSTLSGKEINTYCRGWLYNANIHNAFNQVYHLLWEKLTTMEFTRNTKFVTIVSYKDATTEVKISYKWKD